jgi:alpha-tubulin suppressor-like RCC1 family protein
MKHVFAAAMIAVLCLSAGCDDTTGSDSRPVSTVSIAGDSAGLAVGGTRQMTAVPLSLAGDTLHDRAVVWSSSDSTVAAVSADGLVTARAVGSVTIRATIEGQSGEAELAIIPRGFSGKWSSVSVGAGRSCALAEGGVAYCWGQQLLPPLVPGTDSVGIPTRIQGSQTFALVSTTKAYATTPTCGLTSDGAAYCWGGYLSRSQDGTPARVSGPTFTTLDSDAEFACGLASGGEAYCWGPGLEILTSDNDGSAVPVLSEHRFTSIALGSGTFCGLETAGTTVCVYQRLLTHWDPTPDADGFTSVVVGGLFRCGLRSDGEVLCSTAAKGPGVGGSWELAEGLTPVEAPQPLVQLSAGGSQVCGLTADGLAYCWTVNVYTPVGGSSGITIPIAVGGAHHFVQISTASTHACGVTADGEIYCWGDNGAGELGNGAIGGSSDAPVRVSDPA